MILIIGSLCAAPDACAVFRDDGQETEKSNLAQEMIHKNAYRELVEERKKKSRKAAQKREKRNATLTPFVNYTSLSSSDGPRQNRVSAKNNHSKKDVSNNPPPLTANTKDIGEKAKASIFTNALIIAAAVTGIILMLKYSRPKK